MRLNDLYKNYNKIQKYSKLITEMDVLQKFKTELEKDVTQIVLLSRQFRSMEIEEKAPGDVIIRGLEAITNARTT